MSDPADNLTAADPDDLAAALAFALRFHGRKRVHNANEIMAEIVAKRLVEHLARAGFVVMKRPAIGGGAALGRGFEG
jgi:thioredoxin-like negative regulator of GroEL